MEAMIGQENHRGFRAGQVQEHAEHHVMVAVAALDHALVNLEVFFRHLLAPRRIIVHEGVREVIDRVEVHRHEIPRLHLHQGRGRRLDRGAFREDLGQDLQAGGPFPGRLRPSAAQTAGCPRCGSRVDEPKLGEVDLAAGDGPCRGAWARACDRVPTPPVMARSPSPRGSARPGARATSPRRCTATRSDRGCSRPPWSCGRGC